MREVLPVVLAVGLILAPIMLLAQLETPTIDWLEKLRRNK